MPALSDEVAVGPPRLLNARAYLHGSIAEPISQVLGDILRAAGIEPGDEGPNAIAIAPLEHVEAAPPAPSLRVALFDGKLEVRHASALQRDPPVQLLACRDPGGHPAGWEVRLLASLLKGAPLLAT